MSRRHRAFSLTELLVVLGIILVLLALALPAFLQARKRASRVRYGGLIYRPIFPQAAPPRAF